MEKTVILPTWRESPADEIEGPNSSYATITRHADHRRVQFSGALAPGDDLAEQVRTVFEHRREALRDLGGSMDDVVTTRYFVRDDHLDRDAQATIHKARDEFFERPHYPASTMVGAGSLLEDDALVEIELVAEIPNDEWDVTVVTEHDL